MITRSFPSPASANTKKECIATLSGVTFTTVGSKEITAHADGVEDNSVYDIKEAQDSLELTATQKIVKPTLTIGDPKPSEIKQNESMKFAAIYTTPEGKAVDETTVTFYAQKVNDSKTKVEIGTGKLLNGKATMVKPFVFKVKGAYMITAEVPKIDPKEGNYKYRDATRKPATFTVTSGTPSLTDSTCPAGSSKADSKGSSANYSTAKGCVAHPAWTVLPLTLLIIFIVGVLLPQCPYLSAIILHR